LTAVRERWATVERGVRNYLAGLTEEMLKLHLSYVNLKGETWTYPLGRRSFTSSTTKPIVHGVLSGKRTMNPSRFGIRTLGSVWAFIVSFSPMSLLRERM